MRVCPPSQRFVPAAAARGNRTHPSLIPVVVCLGALLVSSVLVSVVTSSPSLARVCPPSQRFVPAAAVQGSRTPPSLIPAVVCLGAPLVSSVLVSVVPSSPSLAQICPPSQRVVSTAAAQRIGAPPSKIPAVVRWRAPLFGSFPGSVQSPSPSSSRVLHSSIGVPSAATVTGVFGGMCSPSSPVVGRSRSCLNNAPLDSPAAVEGDASSVALARAPTVAAKAVFGGRSFGCVRGPSSSAAGAEVPARSVQTK